MTDKAIRPLRQRMIEDMTIRKLASKTQHDYVQRVKNFAAFVGRSPDTATFEDVRRYQLHLASSGAGVSTLNQLIVRSTCQKAPSCGVALIANCVPINSHKQRPTDAGAHCWVEVSQ